MPQLYLRNQFLFYFKTPYTVEIPSCMAKSLQIDVMSQIFICDISGATANADKYGQLWSKSYCEYFCTLNSKEGQR